MTHPITEEQQLLLDNLSYLNFDVSKYDTMEKLINELEVENYKKLKEFNNKQAFYEDGILQQEPKGKDKLAWQAGGEVSKEEAIALINTIKNDPQLMALTIVTGQAHGPDSRNITFLEKDTKTLITACRGTGAEEWILNGDAIRQTDDHALYINSQKYLENVKKEIQNRGYKLEELTYVYTGHSNGGLKADVMTLETMKMLREMGISPKDMRLYNTLMDGYHPSNAFWEANPDLKAMYEQMAEQGKLLRICSNNDYVHRLGGVLKDRTIYVFPYNPDDPNGKLPVIDMRHHFSTLLLNRIYKNGKLVGFGGIRGYENGSGYSTVEPGPVALIAEVFSRRVVAMTQTETSGKLIDIVMGILTRNKESIPPDRRYSLQDILLMLSDDTEGPLVIGTLAETIREVYEMMKDQGREEEFWEAFEPIFDDKSAIQALIDLDTQSLSTAEALDALVYLIFSAIRSNSPKWTSFFEPWYQGFIFGGNAFVGQLKEDKVWSTVWQIGANVLLGSGVKRPVENFAYKGLSLGAVLIGIKNMIENLPDAKTLATGKLQKQSNDTALFGTPLQPNTKQLEPIIQSIIDTYSAKRFAQGKPAEVAMFDIFLDQLKQNFQQVLEDPFAISPATQALEKVILTMQESMFPKKDIPPTPEFTPLPADLSVKAKPTTLPSIGNNAIKTSNIMVVDYKEVDDTLTSINQLIKTRSNLIKQVLELRKLLKRELSDSKKLSSSERRELEDTIATLNRIDNTLDNACLRKGKVMFELLSKDIKKTDEAFARSPFGKKQL